MDVFFIFEGPTIYLLRGWGPGEFSHVGMIFFFQTLFMGKEIFFSGHVHASYLFPLCILFSRSLNVSEVFFPAVVIYRTFLCKYA